MLSQSFPNPFSKEAEIKYFFQTSKAAEQVHLKNFNLKGQLIKTIIDGPQSSGFHIERWKGENNEGSQVSSGVYFYTLRIGSSSLTNKCISLVITFSNPFCLN